MNILLQNNVKWIFNPLYCSQRGVWKSCIRSVRRILSSLLKEQTLDDESCYTLLCEVESIMNGRLITNISDDPKDFSALTPNQLLLLRESENVPQEIYSPKMIFTQEDGNRSNIWQISFGLVG